MAFRLYLRFLAFKSTKYAKKYRLYYIVLGYNTTEILVMSSVSRYIWYVTYLEELRRDSKVIINKRCSMLCRKFPRRQLIG